MLDVGDVREEGFDSVRPAPQARADVRIAQEAPELAHDRFVGGRRP